MKEPREGHPNISSIDPRDYGLRLKAVLRERRIRQHQLAEMIGVKDATISAYTKGTIRPSIDNMMQIAYVLDKPLDYFLEKPTKMDIQNQGQIARMINALGTVDGISVEMRGTDLIIHIDKTVNNDLVRYLDGIIHFPLSEESTSIERARFNAWNREELARLDELKL